MGFGKCPYAAAFASAEGQYRLASLCYSDKTSGMADCIDPSADMDSRRAAALQTRQALSAVIFLGLAAAMTAASSSDEAAAPQTFWTQYGHGTPGNLGYSCDRSSGECGIPVRLCR